VDTMLVAPVKLGKGSRTGAGSVVTKDVPDGATVVGVPARVVKRIPAPLTGEGQEQNENDR
jgi:acetyltransferase-like isoleucine patch superfamily enzyme